MRKVRSVSYSLATLANLCSTAVALVGCFVLVCVCCCAVCAAAEAYDSECGSSYAASDLSGLVA